MLRKADAIVRAELTAAELDREIWQCPVVLLADVRSVGVQGDGRTYGHPIVLRPVSSEDAMTADWTRLPYDVLARISTRITNEVRRGQPGHPRRHEQAARAPSSGSEERAPGAVAPGALSSRRPVLPGDPARQRRQRRLRALRSSLTSRTTPAPTRRIHATPWSNQSAETSQAVSAHLRALGSERLGDVIERSRHRDNTRRTLRKRCRRAAPRTRRGRPGGSTAPGVAGSAR